ncbi:nucleoside transporter C-terminal domain-containing protein [Enterocloster clostridioformis]|nr:nucleoside transporter C-terminal domain-containing protein [Enterocloster clostridioformis]MDB2130255.1 nucleoside transporter C-terminal domain-containing protein [Enterocloster clostridioformis]MDU1963069.1 nucleoside transporter C-terminal domain-containing protein [Enterocloster clostridioformis]
MSVKMLIKAVIAQFLIAVILVKVPAGRYVVSKVSDAVTSVINCGQDGLSFVFGSLADSTAAAGSVFAIQVLGNIVFLSALVSFLYYIGILGFVVKWIGKAVGKLMGTSEVESFVAVANMFLGQTDSPILVSKYLGQMTDSEVMVVLVSGMGSMSVSILGGYTALGIPMEYLLIASTLVPVGSIMVAMVALVAAVNKLLGVCGISLQQVFSYVFAPFGFFLGLDPSEILLEGNLLGSKLVLNEFVAFQQLGGMISSMDYRTGMICAISLCGFANFSSLGICVSGIAVLCPEKKSTLARLVFKAMLGGVAVSLIGAMVVGLVTLF